jgi:alkanesulfonate monooxygenase SsuD/methylene tetrahydromethanopterin reductase-like flavin-dependent oxidoreductase (luciferase family)
MSTAPWAGIGLALPTIDAFGNGTPVAQAARAAEEAGLDHVWVPDHLLFHRPVLEAITALTTAAAVTERIKLGTAILNPTLRPITLLAKQLATLAALAPDRLLLGVGLGGEYEPEFRAVGVDRKERGRRLDEALDLLPRLMTGERVQADGLLPVDCDGLAPVPDSMPPVLVGGRSEAAIKRAARVGDAYFPMWMDPVDVTRCREQLAELAAEHGRPAPGIALVAFINVTDDAATGREQAAEHIKRQYGMPFDKVERWALIGTAEQIAERVHEYRDAGVDGFSLSPAHPFPLEQIDGVAAVRSLIGAPA